MSDSSTKQGRLSGIVIRFLAAIAFVLAVSSFAAGAGTLQAQAATTSEVTISSAQISGSNVVLGITAASVPASDDGVYYIYADEVYQDGAAGTLVATVPASTSATASFALNFNTADSNLSRKFVVCVLQGGVMTQVSDEHYITNPEAVATVSSAQFDTGIKGLFVDPTRITTSDLVDLGVDQVCYNIYIGDIVGETTNAAWPTTYFTYDGVTYAFDSYMLACYDNLFIVYTSLGLDITVNIINNYAADATDLIHPLALDGTSSSCYAFNTTDAAGVKHLEAIAYFLGQRYNGTQGYGKVDNWVIGNEINARSEQFYMSNTDLDYNVSCYHEAFRIFYNGLKAANGGVNVYTSFDQQWNRLSNSGSYYVPEYLTLFNNYILLGGNIDYGVSIHPYDAPLYDPYAWLGQSIYVTNDVSTPYLTMQNIFVFIDYMNQTAFLSPSGDTRSILISELGYTSYFGDDLQCASIAYAYLQAAYYDEIDGFLMYREVDSAYEITNSKIAQGLIDVNGNVKAAYAYYKYIDTDQAQTYKDMASAIMGYDIDSLIGLRSFPTRSWTGY